MTIDPYAAAQDLARDLRAAGRALDAQVLEDAIAGASTGTEAFMALRWELGQLLQRGSLDAELAGRARSLQREIDRALR